MEVKAHEFMVLKLKAHEFISFLFYILHDFISPTRKLLLRLLLLKAYRALGLSIIISSIGI